ncbi:anti-sigma factor family protein [Paraburkholderia dinghuensis]|uniref:Uncharacterized protein n=1 Tax=Paraburkholderia dinghuensis TaxID=2305225 RepID=A0A3N6MGF8_9BURK|nr:hypothetical protein [Paraburkholderia dinghuensis]RQH02088.1 hypothetical protein D1Y85_22605 [Paraburkholderia dinghuensis]
MILKGTLEHPPVSEADIQAYTDGSVAPERAARVRRYLAMHPGEWRRILFYRRLNVLMRRVFPRFQADPAPVPTSRRAGWRQASLAAITFVMLAGVATAWLATSEATPQMLNDAAVMALIEATNVSAGEAATSTPDMPPKPFDLHAAGLRLIARGTPDLGPLAFARRYVYENAQGQKIVLLCARAWFAENEPQWSARRIGALRLIGWARHGTRCVLAGNAGTHELMRAADMATMAGAGGTRRQTNGVEQAGGNGTWTSVTN